LASKLFTSHSTRSFKKLRIFQDDKRTVILNVVKNLLVDDGFFARMVILAKAGIPHLQSLNDGNLFTSILSTSQVCKKRTLLLLNL
ncbi:MAG: hypothetical protein LCH30_06240, partial [Proteobacteria bacterium]|nr:hypothetical protein [Pseudomonadota bacterium]